MAPVPTRAQRPSESFDGHYHYLRKFVLNENAQTCYIAGPMRGIPEYNFPSFNAAADNWRLRGFNVINPAEIDKELDADKNIAAENNYPAYRYASRDLAAIFFFCDFIIVLPGWRNSVGARAEVALAMWLGLPVYAEDGTRLFPIGFVESAVDFGFKKEKVNVEFDPATLAAKHIEYVPSEQDATHVYALPPECFPHEIDGCPCTLDIVLDVPEHKWQEVLAETDHRRETILEEADRLVHGDRGSDYGHPLDDFTRTVGAFNALTGRDLKPEDGTLFMMCVKLSREANKHKRDNLVDAAGYADCTQQIHEERERRATECKDSSSASSGS